VLDRWYPSVSGDLERDQFGNGRSGLVAGRVAVLVLRSAGDGDAYFLVGANGGAATKLIPAVSSGEAVWPGDGEWIYYSKGLGLRRSDPLPGR
jgi:hypothetical protein